MSRAGVDGWRVVRAGASPEQGQKNRCEHRFHRRKLPVFAGRASGDSGSRNGSTARKRHRLLQVALPAREPGPIGVDIILRAAIETTVKQLPASAGCFGHAGFFPSLASSFFRVHLVDHPRTGDGLKARFCVSGLNIHTGASPNADDSTYRGNGSFRLG